MTTLDRSTADIDWQMRYGETETEQVAQFLGYAQPEENPDERSSHSS